ncbi:hypothetical protein AB0N93_16415 [Streptomyces sp. NPDC091267]|uniref:hypothetical protein n=1 Tax=Streptomyces sp. NPDC091267 TaxID=3155195 RepID=UPI00341F42DF
MHVLLAHFARHTSEHRWTANSAEAMSRLLRIAATRLGADALYPHRASGSVPRCQR